MSREAKILTAILVVVVGGLVGLFVVMNGGTDSSTSSDKVDTKVLLPEGVHNEGTGSVQLVEFGDYQCPACGNAYPYVKKIMSDYNGKVTLYFRNFPLTNVHPNAMAAANAAEEASDLGKFWEMNNKLYETQKEWVDLPGDGAIAKFAEYANGLGIDGQKVADAAKNQSKKDVITKDQNDGNELQVDATPTFYVNGRKVIATGEKGLRDAIDAALKKK